MNVPSWWPFVLIALAAFRTWKLVGDDTILDRPRNALIRLASKRGRRNDRALYVHEMLSCPWCAGFWISLGWWGAWLLWPHGTAVAAVPFAVSAAVGLLGGLLSD